MKKSSDSKKSLEENDDPNTASGSGGSSSAKSTCKEEDVYEFKTTPKDSSSSSGDDKSDNGKSDKSSDEKGDEHGSKRPYSDVEGDDDDSRRKKRKEGESTSKESGKTSSSSRSSSQRQDKSGKAAGASTKNPALTNKAVAALERKSPSGSPKPAQTKSTDSDAENDDKGSSDGFGTAGPKVPPLKIVIPQQSTSTDQETGTRNGKNTSARSHAALPYVVASSSNSNDSADKESVSSRCTSPSDSTKSVDEKKTSTTMTNDEQRQQRVLRSSHRGGQSVDRGSNNSSPQLQSSSPSPAPVSSAAAATSSSTTTTTAASSSSSSSSSSASTATTTTTATTETIDVTSTKPSATLNPTAGGNGGQTSTSPNNPVASTETEAASNAPSPSASSTSSTKETPQNTVELHPRKRKIRASKDENKQHTMGTNHPSTQATSAADNSDSAVSNEAPHPHDQPITNTYQMYIYLRSQIERKHRSLFPVQPKPPQGFKDYLLNRQSYLLAGNTSADPVITLPTNMDDKLKAFFASQERERHKLKMQHVVEKEKLVLSVEQEILRVHGRAARALANQSVPFSACTILKDEEVYNIITPEQEEKDRNARSRYNGRLFLSWLQDVDDKWEKIKVSTRSAVHLF